MVGGSRMERAGIPATLFCQITFESAKADTLPCCAIMVKLSKLGQKSVSI